MHELPDHLKEMLTRVFNATVDKDSIDLKETLEELNKYEALTICLGVAMVTMEHKRPDLLHWLGGEVSEWV